MQRTSVQPVLWRLALMAEWWDRHRQRWCWASIASDLGFGWDVCHWRGNARRAARRCWDDCDRLGTCWCGKFRQSDERVRSIWSERKPPATRPEPEASKS